MQSPEDIMGLFAAKRVDDEWSFSEYGSSEIGKWTHRYHRYPAKFIPQLVEKLIDEYVDCREAHLNDPFYGCGTTVVTAISRGFRASGTDINKIAYLIAKVKSRPIEPGYLRQKIAHFVGEMTSVTSAQRSLFGKRVEPLVPEKHIDRIDYWFTEENRIELGKILRIISQEQDDVIRDFLLVAFSHVLKNCSIWLQRSTKPTRDFRKKPSKPHAALAKHLGRMQTANRAFYDVVPSKVRDNLDEYLNITIGDARSQPVADGSVDLLVSSSPYVTSYEYADLHQLSTIWLDLADDLRAYKKQFIGTSQKAYGSKRLRSAIARGIVDRMLAKNRRAAQATEAFYADMQEVFDESFRVMRSGGRCCYVIGDTRLKGVDILNAEVFAESLQYSGFQLDRVIKRLIPSKILPQKRDLKTGRFASNDDANSEAYPVEYIVVGLKEGEE